MNDIPEKSALDSVEDAELIKGIHEYARIAGLTGNPEYIWRSVDDSDYFDEKDRYAFFEALPTLKQDEKFGFLYVGYSLSELTSKFKALTGLCVRNYWNGRYMSISQLLHDLCNGEEVNNSLLFVPDFFTDSKSGATLPQWRRDYLLSFLVDRDAEFRPLILGVQHPEKAKQYYGDTIMDFIAGKLMEIQYEG